MDPSRVLLLSPTIQRKYRLDLREHQKALDRAADSDASLPDSLADAPFDARAFEEVGVTATGAPSTTVRGLFGASTSRFPSPSLPATGTAPVFSSAPGPFPSSPSPPDAAAFVAHPLLPSPSPPTNPPVAGVLVASKSAPPLDVSASRGPSQLLSAPIPASHTSTATLLLAPLAAERRILASLHSDVVRPWLPLLSDTPA